MSRSALAVSDAICVVHAGVVGGGAGVVGGGVGVVGGGVGVVGGGAGVAGGGVVVVGVWGVAGRAVVAARRLGCDQTAGDRSCRNAANRHARQTAAGARTAPAPAPAPDPAPEPPLLALDPDCEPGTLPACAASATLAKFV